MTPEERRARIDEYRRSQPIKELARKRDIAWRRQKIWTQEHLDWAHAIAVRYMRRIDWR